MATVRAPRQIFNDFGLILEVWGPSLGSILASLGHPWAPMPPRETLQARTSGEKVVSDDLLTKIFKRVGFRIRFFNAFGVIFQCFRDLLPSLSLTTSCTIVPAQNIGFVPLFAVFKARQPFERKACLNKNHMRFACFFVVV